ncbi:acyltransferase family protein [Paenibacillus marinisediminis]
MLAHFRRWFNRSGVSPKDSPWSGEIFGLNLRFLLIVTVFVSNAIEPLIYRIPEMKAIFLWIYTFHMPLFVGVTGYFARRSLTGPAGNRVLIQIALQYIIFQSIYSFFDYTLFQVPGTKHSFFVPFLLLWFLVGHVIWRLLMRLFIHWKVRYPVLLSIVLGILVGFIPVSGTWLALSKTFVYFPFFIIGYSWNFNWFRSHMHVWKRLTGAAISALLLVGMFYAAPYMEPSWLMNSMTFRELGWLSSDLHPIVYRLCIYGIEFIAAAAFLAWVPQRTCAVTDLGKRTLYVFLIHGFIVRFAEYFGLYNNIHDGLGCALLILASIGFTVMLAHPNVKRFAHVIIEPNSEAVFGWVRRGVWRRSPKQG